MCVSSTVLRYSVLCFLRLRFVFLVVADGDEDCELLFVLLYNMYIYIFVYTELENTCFFLLSKFLMQRA